MDQEIIQVLKGVLDPELNSDIVTLGMVKEAKRKDNTAYVTVALTTSGCPLRHQFKADVSRKVTSLEGIDDVKVTFGELNPDEKRELMDNARKNARENAAPTAIDPSTRVIAVASGKGGVGKSSLTANLAVAIAQNGFHVGVLDADIWGFSQSEMLGVTGRLEGKKSKIIPNVKEVGDGLVKIISMGLLVDDNQSALMWRGPILAKALEQFLTDVSWGKLDYLLVDMPPGTGDIQMALARLVPQSEMLVVTTPSKGAQEVAARIGDMAKRSFMPIIGVIENMSYFIDPTGNKHYIFGRDGGEVLAKHLDTQLIAQIPIDENVTQANSTGEPISITSHSDAAKELRLLARKISQDICPPVDLSNCSVVLVDIGNKL